ncbi:YlbG family protein [Geomicrobium sp. JCM 19039]|uniref:YlbG family protein n=1 Tax=Geomicrobium sp. JCM 19039 TaxID=1460636 RepID=UPI00045F25F9|nr:YlbG family protein [Geomicrobium sp. JCM 19039]GAK14495.1 hypothetical protein JCM19039_4419 [Geomicrobium sp. JCM 19039]
MNNAKDSLFVQSLKNVRHLRKYGHVQYVSKKMRYVVLYCNTSDAHKVSEQIKQLNFVHNIEWSVRRQLDLDFGQEKREVIPQDKVHT